MYDNETRMLIATERIEQLRRTGLLPVTPLRLTLGGWLIRAGRRLTSERPSAFPHEPLASSRH